MTSRTLVAMAIVAAMSTACSQWDGGLRPGEATVGKPVSSYPAPPFQALTKPGTIYVERDPTSGTDAAIQTATRYVLYDDGTFGLQASSIAQQYEYRGRYSRADSVITFAWEGWSSAGPWEASAILRGEELIVRYGLVMAMSDFVDATYVRAR